ncbi:uncharacterized protein LOC109855026 [Pseudomyrmex gracilis]|uniref:uncharacterized protein LOC109855026 n=1 Tax=Pseudomyrmex gracilis TaxID=219809 RepID=UPI0009957053|nr:uncharacterized protein LOC109855026 [Pseudomyrmex gracilis]XP_020284383.1 uncharacterized protein LOC109855026 [Pseudomyrmex gracilis]
MKVFALPIKLVPINKSVGNETWQTTKNSLSDVQSASVKRLFNQPNLIVKTIPANSVNKSINNVIGNKTNATRTSNNKSKLPELSIVSVRSEQSALDEQEDIHLLPSKIENKKSEIILVPIKRERKLCGHYEDCENIICDVTIQQYVENGRVSPILAINIEENEINAPLGKHCENEKCDALNIDHNRCRRAAIILNRCDKISECDICGVQLQGWKSRFYHKNCKRKNEYRHNNINKMDLQRERMRERELQILEHAKFRKTDYSNPEKAMEVLQNNEELIIIPKIPVNHQYGQLSRQITIPVNSVPIQSTNMSNIQSVNISSIYENANLKNVARSVSFSVIPQNTITVAPPNAITVTPQNTITVRPQNAITVNPQNTVMVKPQNTITVNPQNTIMMKPQNAIMVKPHNTIISGTLLPIENNPSSINQVRIANLQQQNYVTSNLSGIGTVTTVASVNTPIVTPVNSLSFVANVSTPGVASVTPSVVVVTTPITTPVNSVAVVAASGSVATTATTIVTSTATTTLTIPAVPTLSSGAAPMVRIPIQPQNAAVQPVNNWIVTGSQVISTPQVQHVYRLMPITNLITPPSLLHRTQGIPKFCIMTIPTTSSGVTAAAIVSSDAVVPPATAVTTAAIVSTNAIVPPVTATTSAAITSTNAITSPTTAASKAIGETKDTQSKVKEVEKKIKSPNTRLRSKPSKDGVPQAPLKSKSQKKKGTLCTICKKFIKTDWYYKIHIDRHRMSNDVPNDVNVRCYYCFICNTYFNTECDFMTHAFEKHNGRITNSSKISNKIAIAPISDIKTRKRKLEDEKNCTTTDRDSDTNVKKGKPEDARSSDPSENEEVNDELAQDNDDDEEDNEDDDVESLESANAIDEQIDQDPTTVNEKDKEVDEFAFVTVKEEIDTIKSEIEDIADVSEDEEYFITPSSDPLVTNNCTICRKYIDSSKTICLNCESANSEFSFESCL